MNYIDRFYDIALKRGTQPVTDCRRGLGICGITLTEKACRRHVEEVHGLTDTFVEPLGGCDE
jgi:hypothetical protein